MTLENELEKLNGKARLLISVELKPLQGTRFQPTGFPDIGAATYDASDGTKMLLVESTQSMANRMEAVCWDNAGNELVEPLKGLPYVAVNDDRGKPLTNSILEAHRINSAYILHAKDSKVDKILTDKFDKRPYGSQERKDLVSLLFRYDTNTLLHGIFMPNYAGGRCRIPRALSAFVEAENVNEAVSWGVKNDLINPSSEEEGGAAKGYGNALYPRSEYTGKITAFFSLDLAQIRSYGLDKNAEKLLIALALFKIRKVLNEGLRFRTACDLKAEAPKIDASDGFVLPTEEELTGELPLIIKTCKDNGLLEDSPSITETFVPSKGKGKKKGNSEDKGEGDEAGDDSGNKNGDSEQNG